MLKNEYLWSKGLNIKKKMTKNGKKIDKGYDVGTALADPGQNLWSLRMKKKK